MEFKISFLRIKLRLFANFWGVLLSFEVPALCELIANNANYDDDDRPIDIYRNIIYVELKGPKDLITYNPINT